MAQPIQSWPETLTEAILTGAPNEPVRAHLDALIRWLSGASSPDANAIDQALIKRNVEPSDAANLALSLLERFLFADGADAFAQLGLTPQATEAEIRSRYKRLVSVFHPDRQLGDANWLHECTQKLNLALEEALKLTQAPAPSSGQTSPQKPAASKERYGTRYAGPSKRDQMRAKLGTAQTLQRKVFMILGGIALLSVFYLWISIPKLGDAGNKATATQPQPKMNLDLQSKPQVSEAAQDKPSQDLLDEIKKAEAQRLADIKRIEEEKRLAERVEQEQQALALALAHQKAELEAKEKRLEEEKRLVEQKQREQEALEQALAQQQAEKEAAEKRERERQAAQRATKEAEAKRQAELKRQQEEAARLKELERIEAEKRIAEQKEQKAKEQKALALALAQQAEKEAAERKLTQDAQLKADTANLLKNYIRSYNDGDLEGIVALFDSEAEVNEIAGRDAIRDAYSKFFSETSQRDLSLAVDSITPIGDKLNVQMKYTLNISKGFLSSNHSSGPIIFSLALNKEGLQILSIRY